MGEQDWMQFVYLALVLVLIGPAMLVRSRGMWLRGTALFLAAVVLLMWIHQTFIAPGSAPG